MKYLNDSIFHFVMCYGRGVVSMGSIGWAKPMNLQRLALKPIIFEKNDYRLSTFRHLRTLKFCNFHPTKRVKPINSNFQLYPSYGAIQDLLLGSKTQKWCAGKFVVIIGWR